MIHSYTRSIKESQACVSVGRLIVDPPDPDLRPNPPVSTQVHPLHPDFRCYAKQAVAAVGTGGGGGGGARADPTAGFEAALFLLHSCSALYLYGVSVDGSGSVVRPDAAAAAAAGAAAASGEGASTAPPRDWYFPKVGADTRIPLADWNRSKTWVVDEWTVRASTERHRPAR